jgi:hypothetical protein
MRGTMRILTPGMPVLEIPIKKAEAIPSAHCHH